MTARDLQHSLSVKITSITFAAILASLMAFVIAGFFTVGREATSSSAEKMHLLNENLRLSLDSSLDGIEQSAFIMSRITSDSLDGLTLINQAAHRPLEERTALQAAKLDAYIANHCSHIQETLSSVAGHTSGIVAYYYCINPSVSTNEHGFYYSRMGKVGFELQEPIDASKLDATDVSHNSWYYMATSGGSPTWIGPYENSHLDEALTISYVTPIYKSGMLIGVLGMDMLFDTMIDRVGSLRVYNSGYAFLLSQENSVLYHPELKRGEVPEFISQLQSGGMLASTSSGNEVIEYNDMGKNWLLSYSTLTNGMKLVVCAPTAEVKAPWRHLEIITLIIVAVVLAVSIPATLIALRAVGRPLNQLTEAARELSKGNYDVELSYAGDDEIGELTRAFKTLRDHLRVYISNLNSQVYRDSLTHVKNKAAYDIYAARVNDKISRANESDELEFALVMFDCNSLKSINDFYGHDKGDIYLKTACKLICEVYEHSPIFRIGGDEFVVLLEDRDYVSRKELFCEFDKRVDIVNAQADNPWEKIDIAKGMSTYRWGEDQDIEMVLHRSDQRMYAAKRLRYAQVASNRD